jgi:hypothetical protein
MDNEKNTAATGGIGLGALIFVVFLVLKILTFAGLPLEGAEGLAWLTWFWVFFPLWIGPAVTLVITGIVLVIAAILQGANR